MTGRDIPILVAAVAIGTVGGWIVDPGAGGLVAGLAIGAITALAIGRLGVRPMVAIPVLAGTLAGAFIGRMIVRLLCLPSTCRGLEIAGSILMGAGALVGVGLVIVLATRSFEEHQERVVGDAQAAADATEDE